MEKKTYFVQPLENEYAEVDFYLLTSQEAKIIDWVFNNYN